MKTNTSSKWIILLFAVILFSCDKHGAIPVIDFQELGEENSKTVQAGDELHMEANVEAENKIDHIEVEIHPESLHEKNSKTGRTALEGWEYDTVYTEFSGLRNTLFHKHIVVPAGVEPGTYHYHFTVTDMEGYQGLYEDELEILSAEN